MKDLAAVLRERTFRRNSCILWTGSTNSKGYATIKWDGHVRGLASVVWEQVHGPLGPGLVLAHICDVRRCIALDHLLPLTPSQAYHRRKALQMAEVLGDLDFTAIDRLDATLTLPADEWRPW